MIDEILHELNGSCIFGKLDLKCGFHSWNLLMNLFETHAGLCSYKRLSFGVTTAQ
jgi:hypothetical protein